MSLRPTLGRLLAISLLAFAGWTRASAQTVLYVSSFAAPESSDWYGFFIDGEDGLHDFDGDGVLDPVSIVRIGNTAPVEFRGFVASGATGEILATLENPVTGASLNGQRDIVATSDLTGDGIPDLWMLVPSANGEETDLALVSGAAVLAGEAEPRVTTLPYLGSFGGSTGDVVDYLSAGFDATGDGVPDVLVLESQTVRLYDGANIAGGGQSFLLRYDPPDRDFYSLSDTRISFVPDLTGDGRADVVIADPGVFNPPADGTGRVYVFDGASGGLIRTIIGPQFSSAFGAEGVVAIGGSEGPGAGNDLDGDEVPDLAVSGRSDVKGGSSSPEIFIYSGATGALLAQYPSPACETIGRNLRAVPDTDGDGAADFAYAVRSGCPGEPENPVVVVVASSATGVELFRVEDPAVLPNETWSRSLFGEHLLGSLGDADGDGLWDLVVSAPNAGGVGFTPGPGLIYAFTRAPVAAEPSAEAERLGLSASPNPSRGGAQLSFHLPSARRVRLSIYDALGREVAVLADGAFSAGPHRVATPLGLASGVYVARLVADGAVATRTLAVAR